MVYKGRKISISVDSSVVNAASGAPSAPVAVPAEKAVDVTKQADMGKVGKYAITGAVLFAIGGIVMGKNVIRTGLMGLAAGGLVGFLLSGAKKKDKSDLENKADAVTDEVAKGLSDEYNKILGLLKTNNVLSDDQKTRAAAIVQQLKDAGYSMVKKAEGYVAQSVTQAATATTTPSTGQ